MRKLLLICLFVGLSILATELPFYGVWDTLAVIDTVTNDTIWITPFHIWSSNSITIDNLIIGGVDWTYTGDSWATGVDDDASDLFWDGTNWWIVVDVIDSVYKYNASWVYQDAYYIGDVATLPSCMFWDETNWWVACEDNDSVHKFTADWTYTDTSYWIGAHVLRAQDIIWDGSYWWVAGHNANPTADGDSVWKYNSDWTYTGTAYHLGNQDIYPLGIFWDNINWWMIGSETDSIYKYTSDWDYMGIAYYVGNEVPTPVDLFWISNLCYVCEVAEAESIYKYTLEVDSVYYADYANIALNLQGEIVSSANIIDETILSEDIDDGTITTDDIANGTIDIVDLNDKVKYHIAAATIYDPDAIQGTRDNLMIFPVEDIEAPDGIEIKKCGIATPNATTYTVVFEEWNSPGIHAEDIATVSTVVCREGEVGDLSHLVEAGHYVKIDLPDTDIDELHIWIAYYKL